MTMARSSCFGMEHGMAAAHDQRTAVDALKTAALVVDWGRPADTQVALQSLASMRPAPDVLIRVDNGSPALGIAPLREGAPAGTVFIDLPANIGWPAAVNTGMEVALAAGVDWTVILNNDAWVDPDCVAHCLEAARNLARVGVIGPAIVFAERPDTLWYGGGEVHPWLAFTRHRALRSPIGRLPASSKTGFVTGCCFLVSSEAWRSVGPFRADYFAYYEDAEWCQRAVSAGWTCFYVGEVLCTHDVSSTWGHSGGAGLSPAMAYYHARNPARFAIETKSIARRITRVFGVMTIWTAYFLLQAIRSRRLGIAVGYFEGLNDGFRGKMGRHTFDQTTSGT